MVVGFTKRDKIVDVAVGIVAGDAAIQPKHLFNSQIIAKSILEVFTPQSGVASLDFAEQAFFGGEHEPAAVYIDAAAF